jgi:hypothetical protein
MYKAVPVVGSAALWGRDRNGGAHRERSPVVRLAPWLAALASILLPVVQTGAANHAPVAYTASYKVRVYGLRGSLEVEQKPLGVEGFGQGDSAAPGQTSVGEGGAAQPTPKWRFLSKLKAKGVAKLFVRGETTEDSTFTVDAAGMLRPLRVDVDDRIGENSRQVAFDWAIDGENSTRPSDLAADTPAAAAPVDTSATSSTTADALPGTTAGRASGIDRSGEFALAVPSETLDLSLLIPAIALDLTAADGATDAQGRPLLRTPFEADDGYRFTVLERGSLRGYFARPLGTARLEGPEGPLDTLVFEHQREGSERITTFWLAPSLGYVPARIEQRKEDKKPHLRAQLKRYTTTDPAMAHDAQHE